MQVLSTRLLLQVPYSLAIKRADHLVCSFYWCGKCRALRKRLSIVFSTKSEAIAELCPVFPRGKDLLTTRKETGLDSPRELRSSVIRWENSSTGRVFYTAPTSSPVFPCNKKSRPSGLLFLLCATPN